VSALKLDLFKAIDIFIRIETGPDAGKAYKIQPPSIKIGRDPECQIALSDPKVSREQCLIKFTDNVICVDISSRKTTRVNGKPCKDHPLKPGDIVSFGESSFRFLTKANELSQPKLKGQIQTPELREKNNSKKRFTLFMVVIGLLVGILLFLKESPSNEPETQLLTQEDVKKQIEESRERTALIKESIGEKSKLNDDDYIYNVEKHFISGFRDYQNGQYGRAIDSFGTTIATDQNHAKAHQYAKTARKKRSDLIDTHLRDGEKYREKMMYNRCAAEFEKAIVLMNEQSTSRHDLAVTQLKECRALKSGGFR
jgi:pSer/pThr/pTyr-binding forkhead associated (FHA) protein